MTSRLLLPMLFLATLACGGAGAPDPTVVVSVDWPGADATDVDVKLLRPLTDAIERVDGATEQLAVAVDGQARIELELRSPEVEQELLKVLREASLPQGAGPPVLRDADPSWWVGHMLAAPPASHDVVHGLPARTRRVNLSHRRLLALGLDPLVVARAVGECPDPLDCPLGGELTLMDVAEVREAPAWPTGEVLFEGAPGLLALGGNGDTPLEAYTPNIEVRLLGPESSFPAMLEAARDAVRPYRTVSWRSDGEARFYASVLPAELPAAERALRAALAQPGVEVSVRAAGAPCATLAVEGMEDEEVVPLARALAIDVAGVPGVADVRVSIPPDRPEIEVQLDRAAIAAAELDPAEVTAAIALATGGLGVRDEPRVEVALALDGLGQLDEVRLQSPRGPVPLTTLATVRQTLVTPRLERRHEVPRATVTACAAADDPATALVGDVRAAVSDAVLPRGVFVGVDPSTAAVRAP